MRRIAFASRLAALFFAGMLLSASAAAFTGNFAGQLDGERVSGKLRESAGAVTGTLQISGYAYRVAARVSGGQAKGELQDQTGVRVPVVMLLDGARLAIAIYAQGQNGPATEIALLKAESSSAAPEKSMQERTIDPSLVGHWAKSESYTSGDFSAASETTITLLGDGTYRYGASRLYGGGDAGTFGSEGAGSGEQGRWSASERVLYVLDPASGQWQAYARYYVEGNRALLTYGNGTREVWQRRR